MSKKSESTSRGDSLDAEMTSLKVAVRVRPLNDKEINLGSKIVVDVHGNDIVITDLKVPEHQGYDHRSRVHNFSFDYGFSSVDPSSVQYASQATVFENFGRVVLQALLEGYNCCVITYGQSGSGKTYTMMGVKDEEGLTPRICEGLLMKLEDKAKQNISFAVNISYMEIYNEQVYDLLQKPDERTNLNKPRLRVREHPIHGPFVEGLSTHVLRSRDSVCQLISEGNDNRIKAATYIHERSSRSHAIFTVHCSQACLDESQPKEVFSKLQLVDLAGSEKAGHEFCQSRLKEGASINKSLVTLGNVISALVELSQRYPNGSCKGGKQLFVPYRDSQLTWLMKDSLGGNSHTFMLAAVSPSNECYSETLSTLRYAQRARSVLSIPIVNEDPSTKIIRNLRSEVNKLKSLLINADVLSKKAIIEPLSNISHLKTIMKKSEKKVDHLTRCWFEKWLETYNTVLKKTGYINEGSSTITKVADNDVLKIQNTASNSAEQRTNIISSDCNNLNSSGAQYGCSLKLSAGDSDAILSDKSSSVSSECIILPNETIFYSKGQKSHRRQNYFKECESYLKSASLNHMCDTKCEIIIPPDECIKASSSPVPNLHRSSLSGISYCKNTFKSLPILNSLPVSTPSVHNILPLNDSLFTSFSLPKDIQTLPASTKNVKGDVRGGTNFAESSSGTNSCFEKTCDVKESCGSSQEITPAVNYCVDYSTHEDEVKNDINCNEFLEQKIRSSTSEDNVSRICHSDSCTPKIQNDCETMHVDENGRKQCSSGSSSSNIFTNCLINFTDEIDKVEFNDSVAEESNNFVKLLNQLQDSSVETINHCFQRKDSEILSLLSLSSNDYPPFHSLDDIFNDGDDMEIADQTGSIEFDALCGSKDQCMEENWDEVHSSSDVTDLSDSSDAESEFDYLDFTQNTTKTFGKTEAFCNSSIITSEGQQNLQSLEHLRNIKRYKENLLSIPENSAIPETLRNSDAPEFHTDDSCYNSENNYADVNCVGKTVTMEDEMNFETSNSIYTKEVSHELSPLVHKNDHNYHTGNSSVLCNESLTTESRPHANEVTNSMKILDSMIKEDSVIYVHKNPLFQKRLCSSDSILKTLSGNETKCCSKSDNTVYIAHEGCSVTTEFPTDNNRIEDRTSYENGMNNDINKKTLFRNKDSISDLLGFSVQDLLDMINGKGGAVLKKQNHTMSDERLQYGNTIPDEIQKFIDTTEITDANKLADELLKKKIYQCSTPITSSSNDLVLADNSDQNKLSFGSKLYSDTDSTSHMCNEKSRLQNLDTDVCRLKSDIYSQPEKTYMEKQMTNAQENYDVAPKAEITGSSYEMDNVEFTDETKAESFNNSEGSFKHENLHVAVEEVLCEKENALEYFTFNGCKEILLGSMSDESDYCDDATGSVSKTMKLPNSTKISGEQTMSFAKEIVSQHASELDTVPFTSDLQNFFSKSPDSGFVNENSQANVFSEYSTIENLNITCLAPIQEEAIDEDDVVSEASADDSPNISFQFDSLERPKNLSVGEKSTTYVEHIHKTDAITNGKDNREKLHKSENLSNALNDVSKTFYNKYNDLQAETCAKAEKQGHEKDITDANFQSVKCNEISKETVNPKDMLNFSSSQSFRENLTKSTADTCKLAFEFQNSQKCLPSFVGENYDKYNVISEEINNNVDSPKNSLKLNIINSKEVSNLPNQLCSWDSLSSSTSSDSITFVFVGKDNKHVMSEANSRSIQSSLFSSVSLDSLEKSSVHQNQIACASPRTLSIDSLVAEELLFQLRNSDPVQPLTSEIQQDTWNKCDMNTTSLTDHKLMPKKTNFADTSQLCSNQHLKMHHHMQCNVKNDTVQDGSIEIVEKEVSGMQNTSHSVNRNQTVFSYQSNTYTSGHYHGNTGDNEFLNLKENYSCISPESNNDVEEACSYIKTADSKKHQTVENVHHNISNDCNKENPSDDFYICEKQEHIPVENVFNTCNNSSVTASHFDSFDFENHYDLDLQRNNSNAVLNNANTITSDQSLQDGIVDSYDSMQTQMCLPENICSKSNSFCNKFKTSDHNELLSIKELTEENLKIFNSEFEENQEENFILPPPSTFGGSEDNDLSVISNCSSFSLANHQSKASVDVFSKSTQTEQNIQNEYNKSDRTNAVVESGKTDLIERMMDLMAETLKLIKEQYSRTPKRSRSHTRRRLNFSSDSDKNISDSKQQTAALPPIGKHRKYLSKERSTDSKVLKYIQSILPPDNKSDYVAENFNHPVAHSEMSPYIQKTSNEKHASLRNKVNHSDRRTGCAMGKKPNFYTLPFDFITGKYQCKKPSDASKLKKPDTFSQVSMDYLPDNVENSKFVNNGFNDLSAFKAITTTGHKVASINETHGLKQCLPKPNSSKNHLQHLIALRRQVVEATKASSNIRGNCENRITDSLKSPSSSSEGYLSSVSSRGPVRHLSEASTDSQDLVCTAQHLFPKRGIPKHNVKPLDFSAQCEKNITVSPDARWLNTSADSGAFFLDSPGTEKRANLDEYPTTTTTYGDKDFIGATSSAACTSPKKPEARSPLQCRDVLNASTNPQEVKVPSFSRIRHWDEIKNGRKQHDKTDNFAPGFRELDEIGENYLDIISKESVSLNSSTSSDLSSSTRKGLQRRNSKSSRSSRNSPRLKHVSSQEIQRLLESIENDRRLLQQIQQNHVFNKGYSPSPILPSYSSLEIINDLFYQDTYKSLPSPRCCQNFSASHDV